MVFCFNFRILLAVGKGWRGIKGEGETERERGRIPNWSYCSFMGTRSEDLVYSHCPSGCLWLLRPPHQGDGAVEGMREGTTSML